jgi:hypothetical protein
MVVLDALSASLKIDSRLRRTFMARIHRILDRELNEGFIRAVLMKLFEKKVLNGNSSDGGCHLHHLGNTTMTNSGLTYYAHHLVNARSKPIKGCLDRAPQPRGSYRNQPRQMSRDSYTWATDAPPPGFSEAVFAG